MSLTTLLMILGAVAAFVYGVWAGLGRWDQSPEEIERALDEDRPRRRAARHLTPLDLMSKVTGVQIHRDWSRAFLILLASLESKGPAPVPVDLDIGDLGHEVEGGEEDQGGSGGEAQAPDEEAEEERGRAGEPGAGDDGG